MDNIPYLIDRGWKRRRFAEEYIKKDIEWNKNNKDWKYDYEILEYDI